MIHESAIILLEAEKNGNAAANEVTLTKYFMLSVGFESLDVNKFHYI